MKHKLEQLKTKRSELLARAKTAEAQTKVQDAVKSIDVLDPTSELGRFEDKVRRQEALAAGKQELAASSLDAQFDSLDDLGELTEVEARLAELKAGAPAAQQRSTHRRLRTRRNRTPDRRGARVRPSRAARPTVSRDGGCRMPEARPAGAEDEHMARFLVAPQWQGSPSLPRDAAHRRRVRRSRATCRARRPRSSTCPLEAGEAVGTGVHRLSSLLRTRELVDASSLAIAEPVILIGGDCGVTVAALGHVARRHPTSPSCGCDAHADLHTPETSHVRRLLRHGAARRARRGRGRRSPSRPEHHARPRRRWPARASSTTREERDDSRSACTSSRSDDLDPIPTPSPTPSPPRARRRVYIHVDLDVLDPAAMRGRDRIRSPFGVSLADLVAAITARARRGSRSPARRITGLRPASPAAAVDDLGAILRVVGAARVSPIPTPPAGWRDAPTRAVARGRRFDRRIPRVPAGLPHQPCRLLCTARPSAGSGASLWSTGPRRAARRALGLPGHAELGVQPRRRVRRRLLPDRRRRRTDAVLAHEAVHAQQWLRYGFLMPLLYLFAGRDPLRNRFEIEAGLEDGNYVPRGARARCSRRRGRASATR